MAMNNRGLGRGIQALFEGSGPAAPEASPASPLRLVPIDSIVPNPAQPRQHFDGTALAEMAASIKQHGILQPLLVRPLGQDGGYQLIAGERRLRAAALAGLKEAPVLVRELDDQEALVVTLLENLQREDLNPIEEAKGLEALRNAMNVSLDALAEVLGQGRSTLTHALRLLKLPPTLQEDVAEGRLSASHARSIGALPDGEALEKLRQRVIELGMSTRETDEAASFWQSSGHFPLEGENPAPAPEKTAKRPPKTPDPDMLRLASNIGATLNCKTRISGNPEKGRISLAYESNAQLYDLLEKLGMQLLP